MPAYTGFALQSLAFSFFRPLWLSVHDLVERAYVVCLRLVRVYGLCDRMFFGVCALILLAHCFPFFCVRLCFVVCIALFLPRVSYILYFNSFFASFVLPNSCVRGFFR